MTWSLANTSQLLKDAYTPQVGPPFPAIGGTPGSLSLAPTKPHPHPAKFSREIMEAAAELIPPGSKVLDPFAGTGRIHDFGKWCDTTGIEIESEWASMHERTLWGDSRLMHRTFVPETFDVIFTSPTYGNRMADHHNAKDPSKRNTYKHTLGRELSTGNSGAMHFGPDYMKLHDEVWRQCWLVLKRGGLMLVNVSDFIRKGEIVQVVEWHRDALTRAGFVEYDKPVLIKTRRNGYGANGKLRVEHEVILRFRKPRKVNLADRGTIVFHGERGQVMTPIPATAITYTTGNNTWSTDQVEYVDVPLLVVKTLTDGTQVCHVPGKDRGFMVRLFPAGETPTMKVRRPPAPGHDVIRQAILNTTMP